MWEVRSREIRVDWLNGDSTPPCDHVFSVTLIEVEFFFSWKVLTFEISSPLSKRLLLIRFLVAWKNLEMEVSVGFHQTHRLRRRHLEVSNSCFRICWENRSPRWPQASEEVTGWMGSESEAPLIWSCKVVLNLSSRREAPQPSWRPGWWSSPVSCSCRWWCFFLEPTGTHLSSGFLVLKSQREKVTPICRTVSFGSAIVTRAYTVSSVDGRRDLDWVFRKHATVFPCSTFSCESTHWSESKTRV